MEYDVDFKNHIMSDSEYYMFPQEIDFYTGLARSDKEVLSLILGRF